MFVSSMCGECTSRTVERRGTTVVGRSGGAGGSGGGGAGASGGPASAPKRNQRKKPRGTGS